MHAFVYNSAMASAEALVYRGLSGQRDPGAEAPSLKLKAFLSIFI